MRTVKEVTDRQGCNLIYDAVGGSLVETLSRCAGKRGKVIEYGWLAMPEPSSFNITEVMDRDIEIIGYTFRDWTKKDELRNEALKCISSLVEERKITVPIDEHSFKFEDIVEAHRYLDMNQNIGKVLVEVNS